MRIEDATGFWWEYITGPQMLVEKISVNLSAGKNVVLQIDGSLPWQEQMRDFVMHRVEQVRFRLLNWQPTGSREGIVPELLRACADNCLGACPAGYDAQLSYLKEEQIFSHTVVWAVLEDRQDNTLLRFLSDYRGRGLERDGAFVAELHSLRSLPRLSDNTAVISCNDYIRSSDLLLYANILAGSEQKFPPELEEYVACVVSSLADKDAELIPELLREIDFTSEDPGEAWMRMWNEGYLPVPRVIPSREELEQRVWRAQLRAAFSAIELERLQIAEKYETEIETALSTRYWDPNTNQDGTVTQHSDRLEKASDAELGTLVWMMGLRRNNARDQRLLYIPEDSVRDRIIFLSKCRNNLAHHRVCPPEQMYDLLCYAAEK